MATSVSVTLSPFAAQTQDLRWKRKSYIIFQGRESRSSGGNQPSAYIPVSFSRRYRKRALKTTAIDCSYAPLGPTRWRSYAPLGPTHGRSYAPLGPTHGCLYRCTHHWVPLVGVAGCLEAVTWLLAAAEALVDPEDGEGHRLVEGLGAARARIEMQVVRVDPENATRHK